MYSTEIKNIIPVIRQYLTNQPVDYAYLFGSCSRGEETKNSDIDLLVRYTNPDQISLLDISRMTVNLSKQIHRKVDLVEEDSLADFAQPYVNQDKIKIYERTH